MISSLIAFFAAAAGVLALTPFVRRWALKAQAVDEPGGRRVNVAPIPRLGGIGVAVAFYAAIGLLFVLDTEVATLFFSSPARVAGLFAGGVLMTLVGAVDDLRGLRALHKLAGQLAAAGIAYAAGFRIEALDLPMLPTIEMGALSIVVTTLWIVAVTNAINLIDGLDGLAAGVTFFACVTNFTTAAMDNNALVMLLAATLGGAALAFLVFNFNPASIFMGDSGSLFMGYVVATSSIMGASVKSSTTVAILTPLIALGLPIMDTLVAIIRRVLQRRSIFSPDRGHVHHILLRLGLTHRRAVLTLYAMCIFLATGAIAVAVARNRATGLALLVVSMVGVGIVSAVGVLHQALRRGQKRERGWPEAINQLRALLPVVLRRLSDAPDLEAVSAALWELTNGAPVSGIALRGSDNHELTALLSTAIPASELERDNLLRASFRLLPAGPDAQLEFVWRNEHPALSGETDIMLQLIADACDVALQRCGPIATPSRERTSDSPLALADPSPMPVRSEVLSSDVRMAFLAPMRDPKNS